MFTISPKVVKCSASKLVTIILTRLVTWEYADEIEDGAVYFIRSALLDSQVLDVPNSNYSKGQDLIIFVCMKKLFNIC